MRTLLMALAALLCCPAAAAAAPFAELPFQSLDRDRPATCLQRAGADRVALRTSVDFADDSTVELLRVEADGALVPDGSVRIPAWSGCPAVAAAGSGAAVVAATTYARGQDRVVIAVRDAGGGFSAPQQVPVARGVEIEDIDVAIASGGAAIVAWNEYLPGPRLRVRARVARLAADGELAAPETLDDDAIDPQTVVGMDDAGRATVAWHGPGSNRREVVKVATAAPGVPFAAPQRVTGKQIYVTNPALAVAPDGSAVLAVEADVLRVYERAPGAARMKLARAYGPSDHAPVVALSPTGGAVVAWFGPELVDDHWTPHVARRAPGGAFQPSEPLLPTLPGADGWTAFTPLPAFAPDLTLEPGMDAAVGADGTAVVAWGEAPAISGGDTPSRLGLAVGSVGGAWEGTMQLGGPGRSANGLAALAAPAAVLWTDNSEPARSGRLHRALPGVAAPSAAPAPSVTLRAEPQAVRAADRVIVTARCSAACDLRAVAGRHPEYDLPAGFDAAQLDGPGEARLAIDPWASLVPRGRLAVTVIATAPGGLAATVARLDVRVRHAFVPRPRKPRDVRVVRRGARLVVTWRTARPARAQGFDVHTRRRRGDLQSIDGEYLRGRGRTRFRAVLDAGGAPRWVEIAWRSTEPRFGDGHLFVRVPPP